ncbi:unnamed protein product [Phytophthora fragariaefolia]|uniref:Unnamed protein product n=1 Tax=Phytophthora fragariaefolia TaxID=1490495 RepID=A0A9W6YGY5_9STRA|nr:unnamed protein product [Phytophthora fragariaefolia]
MSGKRDKKKPVFWDRDGVNEGNGNTKEALLKEIVDELGATGIQHLTTGDIREKINTIDKHFREAVDFQAQTGSSITSESTLHGEILKRCPNYYQLAAVFESRPSAPPLVTSDDIFSGATHSSNLHISATCTNGYIQVGHMQCGHHS